MSDVVKLKAEVRERVGKGAARAVRREGHIPGVIYGDKKAPEPITLEYKDIWKHLNSGHFFSTIFEIDLSGKATKALARDCQLDPVKDIPLHVDFLRLGKGSKVSVAISVVFENEDLSPGLKRGRRA